MKRVSIGDMNLVIGDVLVNEMTGEPFELVGKNDRYGFLSNGEKFAMATDKIVGKSEWVAMAPPAVEDAWKRQKLNELRDMRDASLEQLDRLVVAGTMKWSREDCEIFLALAKKYN